jgi:hypothetical protein
MPCPMVANTRVSLSFLVHSRFIVIFVVHPRTNACKSMNIEREMLDFIFSGLESEQYG